MNENLRRLEKMANAIRRDVLEMTLCAGKEGGHIGGAFSCAEILSVLYGAVMNVTPQNVDAPERDRFILSKGHSAIALYAALHENGFLTKDELDTFEKNESLLQMHCVKSPAYGIEISSGSLGVGLSVGIGMALAARQRELSHRVFVLLGNGECNEGCVWEAAMLAGQLGLSNLIAVVDDNKMQLDGNSDDIIKLNRMDKMFSALGWDAVRVDGHNVSELIQAFEGSNQRKRPFVVIADTVKGKGCSLTEGNPEFHHATISQEQYDAAIRELQDD